MIHKNQISWIGFLVWTASIFPTASSDEECSLEKLPCLSVVEIQGDFEHVQGIAVDEHYLWLTSVHRQNQTGDLHKYNRMTGALIRRISVQEKEQYHPGGIALEGDFLWVPVAAYSREGSSTIERRDKETLELHGRFFVPDHIGCLAAGNGQIIGANWDARIIYLWTPEGTLLQKIANPRDTRYQDMKWAGGMLIASGLLGGQGVVDWLSWPSLDLQKRIRGGKTSRGIHYMNEGMAVFNHHLFLLPEDGPNSRLFMFSLIP
ncbi:MAG: DUF6454 family protein [bacterium]